MNPAAGSKDKKVAVGRASKREDPESPVGKDVMNQVRFVFVKVYCQLC